MTIHDKDLAVLAALAVAIVPALLVARKRPRLGLLLLITLCVGTPIAVPCAQRAKRTPTW